MLVAHRRQAKEAWDQQNGARQNAWGPNKNIKKEAILSTNDDFGRFSSFPENICFEGSFFKMDFRRRPFNQKTPGV